MKNSSLEEDENIKENIIKDVRNHFKLKKLKKETNDTAVQDIRNLFRLKKENKVLKTEYLEILEIFLTMGIQEIFLQLKRIIKQLKTE